MIYKTLYTKQVFFNTLTNSDPDLSIHVIDIALVYDPLLGPYPLPPIMQ